MVVVGPVAAPGIGAWALIEAVSTLGAAGAGTVISTTAAAAMAGGGATLATGGTVAAAGSAAAVAAATGAAAGMLAAGGAIMGTFWLASVGADGYTWDCWKPVVLDESVTPSRGMVFRDLYYHPNIRRITANGDGFNAENIRGEHFQISPVNVNGVLAFHATPA
ncbi:hypothetical protein MAJ_10965, partial [Metarhizium majus ARSEF 297]